MTPKRDIYKPPRRRRYSYVPTSDYFRAVVAKCGLSISLRQSEIDPQTARNAIFRAEMNCETAKARANIAAMQIVNQQRVNNSEGL